MRLSQGNEAFYWRSVSRPPLGQNSPRERVDWERPTAKNANGPCLGWGSTGFTRFAGFAGAGTHQPGKLLPSAGATLVSDRFRSGRQLRCKGPY